MGRQAQNLTSGHELVSWAVFGRKLLGRTTVRSSARRVFAVCVLVAVGLSALPTAPASAGVDAGIPALSLNRAYTTALFAGTSTTENSQEGSAYVPSDNALWLVDTTHAYEVDASTDALRRTIPTADFTNALPVGGVGPPA